MIATKEDDFEKVGAGANASGVVAVESMPYIP
jgi:hypothetical protein